MIELTSRFQACARAAVLLLAGLGVAAPAIGASGGAPLADHANVDVGNVASLQRGARTLKSPVREYRPPGSVRGAPGNRRPYLDTMKTHLFLAILCSSSGAFPSSFAAEPWRPNILYIMADDHTFQAIGAYGSRLAKLNPTPNLDQLAAQGVLFEKAFVTTAICCSSRASIYTGQHMRRHGIEDFKEPLSTAQWRQTFPALLREAGYRTAFLGKFAIGAPRSTNDLALPADKFDLWYGFPQSIAFKQTIDGQPHYLTTVMTEKAVDFLKQTGSDRPFCLILAGFVTIFLSYRGSGLCFVVIKTLLKPT